MKHYAVHAVVVGLAIVWMGGCPVNDGQSALLAPAPFDDPARLEVNDKLRATCSEVFINDAWIETVLIAYESDRLNGVPKRFQMSDVIGNADELCDGAAPNCLPCIVAIIEQVYGPG